MQLSLKTKIWMTVLSIVLMFAFFILFYFPVQQEKYMTSNFNKEVENLARTVALGTKIALTEQNFEGVETAMDFVKKDPRLNYVALVQIDSLWDKSHAKVEVNKSVFKTFPEKIKINPDAIETDTMIIKTAQFKSIVMNGEIILAFSTKEIIQSKKDIRTTAIVVSAIVFFIGLLMGFWLAKNISIPVLELRDAALKVGEGDRNQHVKRHSHDEIGELSEAFNKMVEDLSKAEEKIKAAQDQLIHAEKMASLGQLTAGIAHEIQNPLNFVNNFSEISVQLIDEFNELTSEEEKKELLEDFKENLKKINHHGKRADSIVKSMLLHSRSGNNEKQLTDINHLCDEAINLAYHSLRAKDTSFNCSFEKSFANNLSKVFTIQQDIMRVMINLFNNAFYAVNERHHNEVLKNKGTGFSPLVCVSTNGDDPMIIKIIVKDNGGGIPKKHLDKIFHPFYSTKPTGEGTGLGLSLSYDIITKRHHGEISVNSVEGEGTEFVISIPVKQENLNSNAV